MKKVLNKAVLVALVLTMMLSLAACGGGSNPLIGEWVPEGADLFGGGGSGMELLGLADKVFSVEFSKKGTVNLLIDGEPFKEVMKDTMKMFATEEKIEQALAMMPEFKYEVKGDDQLIMRTKEGENVVEETFTFKIEGKTLTMTGKNGVKTIMKRK